MPLEEMLARMGLPGNGGRRQAEPPHQRQQPAPERSGTHGAHGSGADSLPSSRSRSRDSGDSRRRRETAELREEELPEPVSYDEMMARLRQSGESSGKRRRRRSSQSGENDEESSRHAAPPSASGVAGAPAKIPPPRRSGPLKSPGRDAPRVQSPAGSRKVKWILFSAAAVALAVAGGFAGIHALNRFRVEGEGFKVNVARRASELIQRRVTFPSTFQQAEKYTLGTSSMVITPAFGDLLETAEFTDLMLKLTPGSWMSDDWSLAHSQIRGINLVLQPGKVLDGGTVWNSRPAPVDRGVTAKGGFRLGVTSEPASIQLESGRFESLNLSWPGPGGKPETLTKVEGNFRMMDAAVNLETQGGVLATAAWPPMKVQQINARLKGATLDIVSAKVMVGETSTARLTGRAELVPDGRLDPTVDIPPLLLKNLLPEFWSSHVTGQFSTEGAKWSSQFKSGPPAEFSGSFTGRSIVLQGMGFVDKIANLLRRPELSLMEFADFRGNFSWTAKRVRITEISARTQDNFLQLTGWVEVVPGESTIGKLRVEANEVYFAGRPGGVPSVFTPAGDGAYAAEFEISGRGNTLQDSLPVPVPILMEKGPDLPRMGLPDGVAPPAARPAASAPAAAPVPSLPPPSFRVPATIDAPSISPPSPAQKTPAELEQEFNLLLGK
ncbi:MAG: hypothetical protein EOP86_07625 [Verrucomicrobiaceae bacterium]|nr:MAG: hypothetical protein EOP86_07625 [Verrucomicrobiaceae bacterium]